jgi:hypothetical protein
MSKSRGFRREKVIYGHHDTFGQFGNTEIKLMTFSDRALHVRRICLGHSLADAWKNVCS